MPYYAMQCYAMLRNAMLCCAVSVTLCCAAEEEAEGHKAALHQMHNPSTHLPTTSQPVSVQAPAPPQQTQQTQQQRLKALADALPTSKEALFAHVVPWQACDRHGVVEGVLKPWVVKKFVEYLGELGEREKGKKGKKGGREREMSDDLSDVS